jgi:arylsulfatase A-like enzyme
MDVAPARVLWLPAALLCVAIVGLTIAVSVSEAVGDGLLRKPSGQALQMVIGQATDVDRDGFGLIGRITDPAPFDSAIFPYGVDVPGNGVDEDGVAGDLPPHAAKYVETETSTAPWQRHPDIVLVVLESFRADLVGAQLDGQPITPVMTALAAGGLSLPRAYSHNGYTVQSRFHLLAGSLIAYRGARTLIDDARANGYRVGYFSGQDESFGSEEYRVGFDRADVSYDARADVANRYSTFATPGSLAVPFQAVENRVTGFVRDRGGSSQPLFIYVNFEDTHFPYSHDGVETIVSSVRLPRAQITAQNRAPLFKMYANTAANMDRAIGRVLDVVRQTRGREPAVIVTADHGESLFDEGFLGHGYGLNDAQTRVPLIVSNLPMRVPDPFSQIDLRPALNEALRAPPDRLAVAVADPVERPVFQYLGGLARPRQIAFVRRGERFIYDFRGGRVFTSQGSWTRVGEIGPPDQDELRKLINQWEWMNQAQRQHRNE